MKWLVSWSATRAHAVPESKLAITKDRESVHALCGTEVYVVPPHGFAKGQIAALPRCKRCAKAVGG